MITLILVRPQLAENIGMVARAMLNCGFDQLRLVSPRDGWPQEKASPAAAGADIVLKNAQIFTSVKEAVSDITTLYATTARHRDMEKKAFLLPEAPLPQKESHERIGILFGPEASGLTNKDVTLADALLHIPINPNFSSLNLAQSVYAVCYHFMTQPPSFAPPSNEFSAPKKELFYFLEALESNLEERQFFHPPGKKPLMVQNLKNIFVKASLTSQEIQTLHGVVKALMKK